jgi:hypothetical protein
MSADPLLPSFHAQDRLKRTVSRDISDLFYSVTDLDKNCFGFYFLDTPSIYNQTSVMLTSQVD